MDIKIWTIVLALILTSGCHYHAEAHQQKTVGGQSTADRQAEAARHAEAELEKIRAFFEGHTLSLSIKHQRINGLTTEIFFAEMDASKLNSKDSLKAELLDQLTLIQSDDAVFNLEDDDVFEKEFDMVPDAFIVMDYATQPGAINHEQFIQHEIDDITQQIDTLQMLKQDTSLYADKYTQFVWTLESLEGSGIRGDRVNENYDHMVEITYENDQISIDYIDE